MVCKLEPLRSLEGGAETLPLAEGAQLARMSWERLWRRVLAGQVRGWKADGHWRVSADDVRRLAAER